MKLTYLYVYFHKNVRFGHCGFTVALLCDLNAHQHGKVRIMKNQHFYCYNLCQRQRISEQWILSCRTAAAGGWGVGIVSRTINEGKDALCGAGGNA